jgi:hypothetical protein
MDEILEIPVYYRGEQLSFQAKVFSYQYSYKIVVDIFGRQLMYEPDEEGKYRALVQVEALAREDKVDRGLLEAVALVLDAQINK